ncbi:hypothetical protein [Microseira sp. BLCC-F43]|jgi:hypothetical protein|uniref:TRADD-N-associated membrane domain-containing protein n=1 Tax=Microseira sp. BLCC-F43 TaxID=3153602 RepID=UPI0035BB9431
MKNSYKGTESNDNNSNMKAEITQELLRQARLTFNLAFGVTAASAIMTLSGVGLLYLDKVSEASLTAGTGTLATLTSLQYAKEAKEELQKLMEKQEE